MLLSSAKLLAGRAPIADRPYRYTTVPKRGKAAAKDENEQVKRAPSATPGERRLPRRTFACHLVPNYVPETFACVGAVHGWWLMWAWVRGRGYACCLRARSRVCSCACAC